MGISFMIHNGIYRDLRSWPNRGDFEMGIKYLLSKEVDYHFNNFNDSSIDLSSMDSGFSRYPRR